MVLASVVADIIGRAAFGSHPFLVLPGFAIGSPWEFLLYAGLGVLAAAVGVTFMRVLYGTRRSVRPFVARALCGSGPGWAVSCSACLLRGVARRCTGWGIRCWSVLFAGSTCSGFSVLLLVGKIVATSLTIGIGGSGGVFAPSLFMGAMLGSAYGDLMHQMLPGIAGPAGAYGVIGMAAVFAGVAQAPITASIIIVELTGNYQVILPLMFAVVLATGVSRVLTKESIYTLEVTPSGHRHPARASGESHGGADRGERDETGAAALPEQMALDEVIARFTDDGWGALPVVDAAGVYRGTVTFRQVERAMRDNALDAVAGELAQDTLSLIPDESLEQALRLSLPHGEDGLPVVDHDSHRLIGWLTHRDILSAYHGRLERTMRAARRTGEAREPEAAGDLSASLRDYRIVDLELRDDQALAGRRIADVPWPSSSLVLAIRRGGASVVPDGQTLLRRGDRLTLLLPARQAEDVDVLLSTIMEGPAGTKGHDRAEVSRSDAAAGDGWPPVAVSGTVVLEPVVRPGSRVAGRMLRDMSLGPGVLAMTIRRGETVIVPRGDSYLLVGDRITILALSDRARSLGAVPLSR